MTSTAAMPFLLPKPYDILAADPCTSILPYTQWVLTWGASPLRADKGNRKLDKVSMQWSGLELWHYGNRNHDAEDGLCRDSLDEDNRLFRGIYSAYPADNIGIAKWGNL